MKDYVKELTPSADGLNISAKGIALQIVCAGVSLLMARTAVFGEYLPLGLAAVAGVTPDFTIAAAIGAIAGYFIPVSGAGVFKYITAVFAIASIKWLIFGIVRVRNTPLLYGATALAAALATGFATLMGNFDTTSAVMVAIESLLAAGGAFFINKALLLRGRITAGVTGQELVCVIIAANLALISLVPVGFGELSLGRALLVAVMLCAARYGGATVGAVAGTAAGFAVSLSGSAMLPAAMPYALAGMLGGVFSATGKFGCAAAGIISFGLFTAMNGGEPVSVAALVEATAGSIVFLFVPAKVGNIFAGAFSPSARMPKTDGLRKSLVMRLSFASEAMSEVSQTVEKVAERLARTTAPDFESVLNLTEQQTCAGCSLRVGCWEKSRAETVESVMRIVKASSAGVAADSMLDTGFMKKCLRLPKLCENTAANYSEYMAKKMAGERLKDVRSVVTDQFSGISSMLSELATEFERAQIYDTETAEQLISAFKQSGVYVSECSCCVDRYGRMNIELRIKDTGNITLNRRDILRVAEEVCDRSFDPPSVTTGKKEFLVSVSEKAVYCLDFGACQFSSGEGRLCGDAYEFFNDGRGRSFMVVSDGMGTGGRAAVDGAMASGLITRLIKAGFGFDCALRIVNSAMLFKSTDESFATLDIMSFDMFTGKCEFYKAGAAPSMIRRGRKTARTECSSLPAGILREVGFERSAATLSRDDIIVMMSDGACGDGTEWIGAELEQWRDGSASSLAEHIAACARRRRTDGHEDDVTVLSAIVRKAV